MARGRFLSESVAKDLRLNSISVEAELVYLMTIPHLDRDGLIEGDTDILYGTVCPKRRQFIDRMGEFIGEWAHVGLVVCYDTEDGPVLWFKGFAKNQVGLRYDRETPSKFAPPPGYYRGNDGLEAVIVPPSDGTPTPGDGNIRQDSGKVTEASDNGVAQWQVQDQVEVKDQEGESAPARKVVHFKSPHIDPRHFVNGFIPPGKGTTPVEVYYERFDIRQDAARLSAILEDDLVHACPDLEKLRRVIVAYSQHQNYRPGNVALILDWYRDGIPKKDNAPSSNGVYKNGAPGKADRDTVLARARLARESIKTAELTGMPVRDEWRKAIEAAREYA